MEELIKYIESLESESFEGWTQYERSAYITACKSIKEKAKQLINNLSLGVVTNRTLKCSRCGAIYSLDSGETFGCCVAVAEHRTSKICGGELIVID